MSRDDMKGPGEHERYLSGESLVDLLRAAVREGSPLKFCARGSSMSPFIEDGDVITVSPIADASPRIGDVVAFCSSPTRRLRVHRVVGKRQDGYIIKGDNTFAPDDIVAFEEIMGYVTRIERRGKTLSIGLGPERFFIAFLNRRGLFSVLLNQIKMSVRFLMKRGGAR